MKLHHTLSSLSPEKLKGRTVLLRLDFNVPIEDGKVRDTFRLDKSLPTIEHIRKAGAKIIIISHIENEEGATLKPVFEYLSSKLPLTFIETPIRSLARESFKNLEEGGAVLLENLRKDPGETGNDKEFAKKLADLADIFVNDGFAVLHRKHASVVGVPHFLPSFLGFLIENEIEHLSRAFNPERPFLFILGGAKFDTKLPLVNKFITHADFIYIAGALANDCFKAQGLNIGVSKISEKFEGESILACHSVFLPTDAVLEKGNEKRTASVSEVKNDEAIRDVGEASLKQLESLIKKSKCILWNGPLGLYEGGFKEGTLKLAKLIAESDAVSLVGGGDTIAAIQELDIEEKFTFVSSGGGAMLDFLANENLPGIEAIESR